ncbi:hypothetical protein SASC598O02_013290 [Snodgrassella alvi SCGC AB-598-O02]|nr:hypothetical protein SASC598O02_013290 [Snodgrassella alvi SCGC AB-598-O02]
MDINELFLHIIMVTVIANICVVNGLVMILRIAKITLVIIASRLIRANSCAQPIYNLPLLLK